MRRARRWPASRRRCSTLPKAPFLEFLNSVNQVLVIEVSFAAQFYKYIRTFIDLPSTA